MPGKIRIKSNLKELKDLLKDFYTVTKIRIVVFDDNFQKIAAYPTEHSTYCEIIRQDVQARKVCRKCDLEGCRICKKEKKRHVYICHAGLYEAVTPLIAGGGIVIGYLMLGQLLVDDNFNKWDKWKQMHDRVKQFDVDFQALEANFWNKQKITKEKLYSATKIMETCASYLYLTETIAVSEEELTQKIENYINRNIKEEITPEILCDEFEVGRTKLYEIANHSFGTGIAEHIRDLRVKKACDLLKNTNIKISEIAEEVGIPDYNYFTKIFKKNKGLTPSAYRKTKRIL